ncbi:NRDE family protein [Halorussus halophilus]|uniref:NRDE family protein n=1 Tax=Halorussus halophilus TaxID=2650975 RepID=UPI0013012F9B|nr:NRDE family protein [Halorussus halophilus]
MCTLILAWRVFDGTPIAAAANRDEALGRPSRPPGVLDSDPTVVAPQDAEAGGTWLGYNDEGLFVAITNRRSDIDGERSRGLLVRDALASESAADAVSFVRTELAGREYAGFNLVVADAEEATLLEWDGVLRTSHLGPGVHVVVNEGHNGAAPKAKRIREAAHPEYHETADAWFDHVKGVLRDHDLKACVHAEGYGTKSSSLVTLDEDGTGRYWFADGKPCETDYERVEIEDNQF